MAVRPEIIKIGAHSKIVSETRLLNVKKESIKSGLFIVEGKKAALESLRDESFFKSVSYAVISEGLESGYRREFLAAARGLAVYEAPAAVFGKMSDTMAPEGILLACKIPRFDIDGLFGVGKTKFFILLDSVNDPGNLGTIIRTADNFGVTAVFTTENSVYEYCGKTVRSAMGSFKNVPVIRLSAEGFESLKKKASSPGTAFIVSDVRASEDLAGITPAAGKKYDSVFLVAGSESHGIVSGEVKELLESGGDVIYAKIPCYGSNESLNLSVATGIFCYNIRRNFF